MATVTKWTPFGVALDITATGSSVTRTSATQFTVKVNVSWETYYEGAQTNYGMTATSGGVTHTISAFNGTKRSSGSGSFTGTYSISGNGSATKTITVTFRNFNTDTDDSATKSVSFDVTVPAWTSYTVSYNANGGSGAPDSQTKWRDQTLTLSSTKPTRTGYSFQGWSTSSTATSATYSAGGNYTANSSATLYAVWKANTYQVIFNANGGTGAPAAQTKTYGVTLTLSGVKPTRTNYNFLGWGTSASATAVTYNPGGSYTANSGITLYAVWELAYTRPRINDFTAKRCDGKGNVTEEGTSALVQFSWTSDLPTTSIELNAISSDGTTVFTTSILPGGTSGTYNRTIGSGKFSIDSSYTIHLTVADSGGSYERSLTLNGYVFPIDALYGGNGVAFGKPAEVAGYADFALKALFTKNTSIFGRDVDGSITEALNPQNESGNTVIGWGNYDKKAGNTNVYGYDLNFGVANIAEPGTYRPYRRRGDALTVTLRTAGYVTNSSKDVSFWIPMAVPIVGSPMVTLTSGQGFVLRQGNAYTHGSSASGYVFPTSYEATATTFNGIYVKAVFSDTTNVTNNDAIGIYWNGTITLS